MAARPPSPDDPEHRDGPDFGWLYGSGPRGGERRADGVRGADGRDEETVVTPVQPRDRSARPSEGWGDAGAVDDPEPTRRLPTMSRPASRGPYQTPPPSRSPVGGGPGGPGRSTGGRGPGGPGSSRPVAPPPSRPSRGRPRPRLRWLFYLLLLWLVFLVAVPILAWQRLATVDATPDAERPDEQAGTTYLLVGSDSRQGLTRAQKRRLGTGSSAGRRTDTIMLLHTGAGPNLLLSVPRDSIVDIPGRGSAKINSAYASGGPELLVETVEANTGIRVDDYVEIGFAGFVDVVDAVGGIEICPTQRMKDRRAALDIEKGCQDADGRTALGYARSRHTSGLGDIARARHQREVVSAVGAEAVSPWTVLNPVRYARLALAGADAVTVGEDTGLVSSLRFAFAMTRVDGSNGLTCSVPISDLEVNWDPERSRRLFRLIAEDRTEDVTRRLCRASGLSGG
ncbi:MAG TPA: LCP family protein [Nocardioidaceae bacterium]|nr:LCP family protein [Nocardioidaceae bacterium]